MASPTSTEQKCPQCGAFNPEGVEICANCHAILAKHAARRPTPAWVIALLAVVILGLLVYIAILCRQIFVLHQFS